MSNITLEFKGVEIQVQYDYQPATGDGWNEPHEPECVVAEDVLVRGMSIYPLLDDDQIFEIEQGILSYLKFEMEGDYDD